MGKRKIGLLEHYQIKLSARQVALRQLTDGTTQEAESDKMKYALKREIKLLESFIIDLKELEDLKE